MVDGLATNCALSSSVSVRSFLTGIFPIAIGLSFIVFLIVEIGLLYCFLLTSSWRAGLRSKLAELPLESLRRLLVFPLLPCWFAGDGTDLRLYSPAASLFDRCGVLTEPELWLNVGEPSLKKKESLVNRRRNLQF